MEFNSLIVFVVLSNSIPNVNNFIEPKTITTHTKTRYLLVRKICSKCSPIQCRKLRLVFWIYSQRKIEWPDVVVSYWKIDDLFNVKICYLSCILFFWMIFLEIYFIFHPHLLKFSISLHDQWSGITIWWKTCINIVWFVGKG